MNILYFIPPLIALALLGWWKTRYGLYIILATVPAFLARTSFVVIPTTWLELGIYTVAVVWFLKRVQQKNLTAHVLYIFSHIKHYVLPVTLLFIALLISTIISDNQAHALGTIKAWFIAPIIFSIVFLDTVKTKQCIKNALFFFSLSSLPIMLYGFFEYMAKINMTIPGRLDSFFASPNYVAMYIVPQTVLILGLLAVTFIKTSFPFKKIFPNPLTFYFMAWTVLAMITLLLTQSFGGFLGLFGGILFLVLFLPRFTKKKLILVLCLFLAILTVTMVIYQKSGIHYDRFWQVNSLQTRHDIWLNSLRLTARHPFFGIGLADFSDDYTAYIETLPRSEQPPEHVVLLPHNVFIAFWLETGLLGLTALLWIISIFFTAKRTHLSPQIRIPSYAAMIAVLLHGFVDTPYFKNDLSFLFWFLITITLASCTLSQKPTEDEN